MMRVQTFEEVWPSLQNGIARLHEELQNGIRNATQLQHERLELAANPLLWATLVRSYVVNALDLVPLEEDDEHAVGFNLSISLHHHPITVRVLKAPLDKMPQPGNSVGRKLFFNQDIQYALDFEVDEADLPCEHIASNFVLKWSADEWGLRQLTLACPKPTEQSEENPVPQEWFWVQNVIELSRPVSFPADQTQGHINDAQFLDLPNIQLLKQVPEEFEDPDSETGTDN